MEQAVYMVMFVVGLLAPSVAWVANGYIKLLAERDRKLSEQHANIIKANDHGLTSLEDVVTRLQARVADCEKHIGNLTDRSMR
jgi:hypothetical protein